MSPVQWMGVNEVNEINEGQWSRKTPNANGDKNTWGYQISNGKWEICVMLMWCRINCQNSKVGRILNKLCLLGMN